MCNDGLSAEASVLVGSILSEGGVPPLRVLHFYNNMSGSEGAAAVRDIVKQCPLLEDFRYSATRPGAAGCLAIAEVPYFTAQIILFIISFLFKAIDSLTTLRRVDVADLNFSINGSVPLAEALKKQVCPNLSCFSPDKF